MKKTAKKLLSVFLVVAMIFSLNITAFAGSISIGNTNDKHTYEAYQVFSGTLTNDILTDIVWGDGVDGEALLAKLKETSAYAECADAAEVAEVLGGFADDSQAAQDFADIVAKHLTDVKATGTALTDKTTATIAELADGYYLVQDSDTLDEQNEAATRYILEVVGAEVIEPKSEKPTVVKKVLEDTDITAVSPDYDDIDDDYNDVADWDIGESKSFLISAKLPATIWDYDTYEIIFHDTLSYGLSVLSQESYEVYYSVDGEALTKFAVGNSSFNVAPSNRIKPNGTTLTCTNEDILTDLRAENVEEGKSVEIVITYNAMLNEDAIVGLEGNPNKVYLEYSNNPYTDGTGKTEEDEVKVFTFEISGTKIGDDADKTVLQGAEFVLYKGTETVPQYYATFKDGKFTGWVSASEYNAEGYNKANCTLTSDDDGTFKVKGLDADTYYLEETKAPDGYNKLKNPVEITIEAVKTANGTDEIYNQVGNLEPQELVATVDGTTTHYAKGDENNSTATAKFEVENKKGSELPSTGDTGRTIFYAIGAMGFSLAAIVLITRKRMAKYK